MAEQVDRRLLALDLLPESAYRRYREESREKKKEWNQINRAAKRTLSKQKYEAHMMFRVPKDLAYLTIVSTDISFKDGVLFEG